MLFLRSPHGLLPHHPPTPRGCLKGGLAKPSNIGRNTFPQVVSVRSIPGKNTEGIMGNIGSFKWGDTDFAIKTTSLRTVLRTPNPAYATAGDLFKCKSKFSAD